MLTNAGLSIDASLGCWMGVPTDTGSNDTLKAGYVGQLYQVTNLQVVAASTTINESASLPLTAIGACSDETMVWMNDLVAWSVVSGPIVSVSTSGVAFAAVVYQNEPALVQAAYSGVIGVLALVVVDTNLVILGYDEWEAAHFGLNNTNGLPSADPDGDGQNNLFEFIASTDPTNRNSSFDVGIMDASHATTTVFLTPAFSNRTYVLYRSEDLLDPSSWVHITNVSESFVGQTLYITDLAAPTDRAFYKVGIIYVGQ